MSIIPSEITLVLYHTPRGGTYPRHKPEINCLSNHALERKRGRKKKLTAFAFFVLNINSHKELSLWL